jgi:taurine dioxygenase
MSTTTAMKVTPLTPVIGAEITGIDVRDADKDMVKAVHDALLAHCVVVIRGQELSPPEQIAFTENWGPLVRRINPTFLHKEHPDVLVLSNRVVDGKPAGATEAYAGFTWHADLTYAERPSMGSMLHALEVPEEGGDTAFANMYAAYDALPEKTKKRIENLKALHIRDRRKKASAWTLLTSGQVASR